MSYNPLDTLVHDDTRQNNLHNELQFQEILDDSHDSPWGEYIVNSSTSSSHSTQELLHPLSYSPNTLIHNKKETPSGEDDNDAMINETLPYSPTISSSLDSLESLTAHSTVLNTKLALIKRLEAYRNNAWELMVMKDTEIPPGKLYYLRIKITADNNPNIRPLHSQNDFVLISALYPQPQINDGIYHTNHKVDKVVIKNSSKDYLCFKQGEIVEGIKAHTYEFVIQSIMKNYNYTCGMDKNNWIKWHQEAKLFQKILAQQQRFTIQ